MTKKELLTAIASKTPITDEMAELAAQLLETSANAATARNAKAAQKTAEKNAPLIAELAELLKDGKVRTATDIATELGWLTEVGKPNTSKATAVAKGVDGIKVGQAIIGNRAVKTYSL